MKSLIMIVTAIFFLVGCNTCEKKKDDDRNSDNYQKERRW